MCRLPVYTFLKLKNETICEKYSKDFKMKIEENTPIINQFTPLTFKPPTLKS